MGFSTNETIGLVALVGGLVAAAAVVGVGPLSATDGPSDGDNGPVDDDATAKIELKVNDQLADSQPNYVNASYYVYNPDDVEVASGTTDTTQGFSTISELKENTDYRIVVQDDDGSGSDYYYNEITHTTSETTDRVIVDTEKEGSVATDIFETSGSSDDDDTLKIAAGQTESMTLELEENTQDAHFNDPALVMKNNDSSQIAEMEVNDGTELDSVPDRLSSFDEAYDLNSDGLTDFDTEEFGIQITRDESNTADATVDMTVIDLAHYQDDTGSWVSGYEDTGENDIGAGDTSTNTVTVTN